MHIATRYRFGLANLASAALLLGACGAQAAERAVTLKFATVAPKGSVYHRILQETGEQWRKAEGAGARFIVYTDGTQGSEADAVRRMRVGQLHGAMLSTVGLVEIDESVAALQNIPLMFRSWDEVDYVRERIRDRLEARMRAKGFVVLFWGEGGWVQFFSKEARLTPEDFRSARIFAWAGDTPQVELMKTLGYRPVVLELADVLPSLQTGMIDTVPAAPIFALATQFDRVAPHMLRINWAPIVGATVLTVRAWDAMSPDGREALTGAAAEAATALRAQRAGRDDEIIRAMEARGLKVAAPGPEAERAWRDFAASIWPRVRGSTVPAEFFDRVTQLVAEYRARKP